MQSSNPKQFALQIELHPSTQLLELDPSKVIVLQQLPRLAIITSQINYMNLEDFYKDMREQILKDQPQGLHEEQLPLEGGSIIQNQPLIQQAREVRPVLNISYKQIEVDQQLEALFIAFAQSEFVGKTLYQPGQDSKFYYYQSKVELEDKFSFWSEDHLVNQFRVCLENTENFPQQFKVPEDHIFSRANKTLQITRADASSENKVITDLGIFLQQVKRVHNFSEIDLTIWQASLEAHKISHLDWLISCTPEELKQLLLKINYVQVFTQEIKQLRANNFRSADTKLLSASEILSARHRVCRFLTYKTKPNELQEIPYLNKEAILQAFREIRLEYEGEYLLNQLENFYLSYTIKLKDSEYKIKRGMILYGPPGTGKTTLQAALPVKLGLTPVCQPIGASELNRSLVGETEQLILNLVQRANKFPYLLCYLAIDEIDGLVPKRNEKSSQHKNDTVATFLAVIEGIKDQPNLAIISSTNKINQIDEAFLRRMPGKFFVGRPSPDARRKLLQRKLQNHITEKMYDKLILITTNFTGASLSQLIIEIKNYLNLNPNKKITMEIIIEKAIEVCKSNRIKLGSQYLPRMLVSQNELQTIFSKTYIEEILVENAIIQYNYKKSTIQLVSCPKFIRELSRHYQWDDEQLYFSQKFYLDDVCPDTQTLLQEFQRLVNMHKDICFHFFSPYQIEICDLQQLHDQILAFCDRKHFRPLKGKSKQIFVWDDIKSFIDYMFESQMASKSSQMLALKQKILNLMQDQFNVAYPDCVQIFLMHSENDGFKTVRLLSNLGLKYANIKSLEYSGRIIVNLHAEEEGSPLCIEYELINRAELNNLFLEPIVVDKLTQSSHIAIPQLISFAKRNKIEFIQYLDRESLNAKDDSDLNSAILERIDELEYSKRSLLIINADSICGITPSLSESSMGVSKSYSIHNQQTYNLVKELFNEKPRVMRSANQKQNQDDQIWVAIITNQERFYNLIQTECKWPKKLNVIMRDIEEQRRKEEELVCKNCRKKYTEDQNNINQCTYHPGQLYSLLDNQMFDSPAEAREYYYSKKFFEKNQSQPQQEPVILYNCCQDAMNSQGCEYGRHQKQSHQSKASQLEKF